MSGAAHTPLKPCPFCGNDGNGPIEDALQVCYTEFDWRAPGWSVQCDKCSATMGDSHSEDEAIDVWNTRFEEVGVCEIEAQLREANQWCNTRAGVIEKQLDQLADRDAELEKLRAEKCECDAVDCKRYRLSNGIDGEDGQWFSQAAASRLRDCWGACEGIADPSVVPELVAAARGLASDVQNMIDCRGDCGEWGSECPLQDAHKPDSTIERLQRLLDALAKIGGDV